MSYKASAFMFYGVPLISNDDSNLSDDNFEVITTGSWATGNPSLQDFVMVKSTYQRVISENDSISFNSLAIDNLPSINPDIIDELYAWIKENDLQPHHGFSGWYIGCSAS